MKKFTIKGVLDGIRGSVGQQTKCEAAEFIEEPLRPEHFQLMKTVRHGFPHQPTAMAFDPVQRILAIGTKSGSLRILGRPGVDCHVTHEGGDQAIVQILFLVNEGALVTVCSDDSLHLWNLRQKKPDVVHSLKFQKERITYCQLPFQSKWLYIGTERGNVHVVNIESFILSGYVINWNKAIELSRKTHPGSVVHLSDNPIDSNKMLIGFESGAVVLWDLRTKMADVRYQHTEPLRSITWHHEGKQFMCSHTDGSLTTWNIRTPAKPVSVIFPHAKSNKDGKLEPCKSITKLEWKSQRGGEMFIVFSGGLPHDRAGRTPSITVIHGKTTTVLEMEHNVVDFITLCESPWQSDFQEPYAIVVLLHNDLVVVDLTTPGYLCFENPYPMDLHESAVTCCTYLADCPSDLVPAFYSVGSRSHKRTGYSEKSWPISGGAWGTNTCSYPDLIITGHADGSLKFWDASAILLQILYKLKTAKIFEKPRQKSIDGQEEDPFAIQQVALCPESRLLCVANASSHVILYRFSRVESVVEITTLEISILYEVDDVVEDSPEYEYPPRPSIGGASLQGSYASSSEENKKNNQEFSKNVFSLSISKPSSLESLIPIKVKTGPQKRTPGFQVELVCLTPWVDGEPPGQITSLGVNSCYGLMIYGNESGLVIVDICQKTCLLNIGTPDLYGSSDPYQRIPRSPKRNQCENNISDSLDRCRSPTSDQLQLVPTTPIELAQDSLTLEEEEKNLNMEEEEEAEKEEEATAPLPSDSNGSVHTSSLESQPLSLLSSSSQDDLLVVPPQRPPRRKKLMLKSISMDPSSIIEESEKQTNSVSASNISTRPKSLFVSNDADPPSLLVDNGGGYSEGGMLRAIYKRSRSWRGFTIKGKGNEKESKNRHTVHGGVMDGMEFGVGRKGSGTAAAAASRIVSIDLRFGGDTDDDRPSPVVTSMARRLHILPKEKIDNSFSRSRSSSMSSLENISSEAIQCLVFAESYTKKSDCLTCPTLWLGTSLGSVLVIILNLPPTGDLRQTQPVIVSPSGTIFRLKGAILTIRFLDCNGALVHYQYENWKDVNKLDVSKERERERPKTPLRSPHNPNSRVSPTTSSEMGDRQFVVMVAEKQACVVALPSQTCAFKMQLTDNSFIVKADVITVKDSVCLVCYVGNGHLATFSLPSLRPLMDVDFLPLTNLSYQTSEQGTVDPMISIWGKQLYHSCETDQIARTFCFSNYGQGMYLCSPCEIQKFTVFAEFCDNLNEMLGDLFLPCETPEAPKEGFFKNFFGAAPRTLDREELFGEASGKPSRSVAKHIPGGVNIEHLNTRTTGVASEVSRAHKAMIERGDNLGQLEDRTVRMMTEAEVFSQTAHQLMLKNKDKKWYQF